jgi:hypothetical protein
MQTVLESLEQAYLNTLNIENEANREDSNSDTYIREEIYCAKSELIKAIVLIVNRGEAIPMDKRVYLDLINTKTFRESDAESYKNEFLAKLYSANILTKELTVGELIENLKRFAPSLKVKICGTPNNKFEKFVIDDTYLNEVILVPVKQ